MKFEIERIVDPIKRKDIRGFERILGKINVKSGERLIALARKFNAECNLGSLDALHLAAACAGKADVMLTCDDEILESDECIRRIAKKEGHKLKAANPISYLNDLREKEQK